MTVKVLLFGPTGQVGNECRRVFGELEGVELVRCDRQKADFSAPQSVYEFIHQTCPDWVVNACAYTAVDNAETDSELAHLVNAKSVGMIGTACRELNIPVLHISTDYVFNGEGQVPYREDDPTDPLGIYGISKLAGEKALQAAQPHHIILRTSWVFSSHGGNFVKTMLRIGQQRSELSVINDQFGCPTFAGDIAAVIARLVIKSSEGGELPWGIYHCSNSGACSWYDFAQSIFELGQVQGITDPRPSVIPIPSSDYPTPVKRPAFSVLDCHKLEQLLGRPMPHWRKGLEQTINALKV